MKPTRIIVLTWIAWAAIVIAFQALATARFVPQFPDRAQDWTTTETASKDYQRGRPFLLEPFMKIRWLGILNTISLLRWVVMMIRVRLT